MGHTILARKLRLYDPTVINDIFGLECHGDWPAGGQC